MVVDAARAREHLLQGGDPDPAAAEGEADPAVPAEPVAGVERLDLWEGKGLGARQGGDSTVLFLTPASAGSVACCPGSENFRGYPSRARMKNFMVA